MAVRRDSSTLVELHCHTCASDGLLTPTELVKLARLRNIGVLAVTDHDTLDGHAEADEASREYDIYFIRGIEVSSLADQGEVHVLGYGVKPHDPDIMERIHSLRGARDTRAKAIVGKLHALGISVALERVKEIAGDSMVGRPHIARAMLEGRWVESRQQAFDQYLGEGKPAFVPHTGLTPAQAVDLIHRANGIAVVAHPGLFFGDNDRLLAELLEHNLDGIEAFYPQHSPEQVRKFTSFAQANHLLITGGSDFHGLVGDQEASLGSIQPPPGSVDELLERIERHRL